MNAPSAPPSPSVSSHRSEDGVLHLYRELWRLSTGQRGMLLSAFALLLGSQLIKLGTPYLAGRAINTLQLQGIAGLTSAGGWLALVFGATLLSWVLHGPGRVLERNVALTVRGRVSSHLVERLLRLPLPWHEAHHSGATAHRVSQSSRALSDFAQTQFVYLQSAVRLVGPVVALWLIEPWVGATAMLGLMAISASITGFDRAMIRLAHAENDAERQYSATLIDTMSNITSVFALRQARGVIALIGQRLQNIYTPLKRTIIVNEAKWCTVDVLAQGLSCSLLALYVWLMARGVSAQVPLEASTSPSSTLPLGNIYMVWEYALQAGGVIAAVASHFQTFARQQADYASAAPIEQASLAWELPSSSADPISPKTPLMWQTLSVTHLTFQHTRGGSGLVDIDLTLESGKRYALIGSSGSGKSTLLRVLAGLYTPQTIALHTRAKTDLSTTLVAIDPADAAHWLRRAVTLIPQDAEVFEGSLADNLALCERLHDGPPRRQDFAAALSVSCAADFLDTSEAGLTLPVAERGSNWSGGQRQRVALARGALAAEGSALVLLDEPTASLDPHTEQRVYLNLFNAFASACVVSSVHRLNLLPLFDEVLIMDHGRLIDHGSIAELCERNADFRAQWATQRLDET